MTKAQDASEAERYAMDAVTRAARTGGGSQTPIYEMVRDWFQALKLVSPRVLDIACGTGSLIPYLKPLCGSFEGADLVKYENYPAETPFHFVEKETGRVPLPDGSFDAVLSLETIEHLENPRAFVRELVRLAKPGGWVAITTPNQLNYLSLLTLLLRGHFIFFGPDWYPSHLSALLELDLRRIAGENHLSEVQVIYGNACRLIFTGRRLPRRFTKWFPRLFSDNVMIAGRTLS